MSLTSAALPAMMRDPQMFIQSLDTIDPVVVNKMIAMVNELIKEGEQERQGHVDRQALAQTRFDQAVNELNDKTEKRNIAAGNVKSQEKVVENLQVLSDAARSIRDDRKRELDIAVADKNAKHNFRLKEVKRIDSEKDLLQQITVKLQTLLPGVELIEGRLSVTDYIVGRNLLSTSNADRDAVQKVVDKVNAMVGAGEAQRAAVIKADEEAHAAADVAEAKHAEAVKNYEAAASALSEAEGELGRLEAILSSAQLELDSAQLEYDNAQADLKKKIEIREREDKRLDSEKETCEEILKLLNGFLQ